MLLFLLACSVPEPDPVNEPDDTGSPPSDSGDELACGPALDDVTVDPEKACHDANQVLVEIRYDGPGTHFAWTGGKCFVARGGIVPDVDAPSVVIQCPPCRETGTVLYDLKIDFTDDDGNNVGWGFDSIAQVCPAE